MLPDSGSIPPISPKAPAKSLATNKTATTQATFEAGVTRRLEADLSGLPKDLSLQWK